MQCGFSSDAVRFSVGWSTHVDLGVAKKQSTHISVNSKFLLNRKELERVFYMKELRIVDIFLTRIIWIIPTSGLQKFREKRPLPLVVRCTIFKINLKL